MARDVTLVKLGSQKRVLRRSHFVGLYACAFSLALVLAQSVFGRIAPLICVKGDLCWRLAQTQIMDPAAAATLLAGVISAIYLLRQFSMTFRPHLDGRLQRGVGGLARADSVWTVALHNNGGGPAFVQEVQYHIVSNDRAISSVNYDDAHRFLLDAGLADGRDFDLYRYVPGACIRAGAAAALLHLLSEHLTTSIKKCDIAIWFRDALGDEYSKLVVCVPDAVIRVAHAYPVPPTVIPDSNKVG